MITLKCPKCGREYETWATEVYCIGERDRSTIGHKMTRMKRKDAE